MDIPSEIYINEIFPRMKLADLVNKRSTDKYFKSLVNRYLSVYIPFNIDLFTYLEYLKYDFDLKYQQYFEFVDNLIEIIISQIEDEFGITVSIPIRRLLLIKIDGGNSFSILNEELQPFLATLKAKTVFDPRTINILKENLQASLPRYYDKIIQPIEQVLKSANLISSETSLQNLKWLIDDPLFDFLLEK
jgi:hypothetical protein